MKINFKHKNDDIPKIEISLEIPVSNILIFLNNRGYEVKSWVWEYEDETFPNGCTTEKSLTFTATKRNQKQSEDNIYSVIFQNEILKLLKSLNEDVYC